MSRTLMISDIHGCVETLQRLLEQMRYAPGQDTLLLLGDYVDRGPQSRETVDYVMALSRQPRCIALRGNHDQRLVDLVRSTDETVAERFLAHGGAQTVESYCGVSAELVDADMVARARGEIGGRYGHQIEFLASLPLYHEDERHLFVHAGINPAYADWREQPEHDFMYIKAPFHQAAPLPDKTVVFGHTRTIELHGSADVWFGDGKIGIDGGCAYGQQLNGLIYEAGSYRTLSVANPIHRGE